MTSARTAALLVAMTAAPAWASEAGSTLGIPNAVWLPVNLAAFLFLLYWFVGRPISSFLDSRRESIGVDLEAAARKLEEAEALRTQVLSRLDQVEGEIVELKERAEREGAAEAERIKDQGEADQERFLRRVEDEIERRHAETRNVLAAETAALTAQLTRELLSREITEEDRKRVLERSLGAMQELSGRE